MAQELEWYAYKHNNGTLHLKRYWGDYGDIMEAKMSPFVRSVTGPFKAHNQHEAHDVMKARFGTQE